MSVQMVLLPVFVLVALTLGAWFWTGRRGAATGRNDAADAPYTASQLDLLFYALVALGLPLRKIDLALVCLSWVFVVTRFLSAGIFGAGNGRSQGFLAGALVLLAMWFYFALRMLLLL
ncbi:hypothetical protein [Rhodopseudomonas sp. P2A-2r]|uniref:hypothetical protein n=1 Tax=unclassified Rhodopseudomonas TaxID=2638247 RepID=UPI00223446E7|nr:hypothetical protein [Rhodopseudomonas sp. P2A-2r]UZE47350.1 hypothetical protein ONR75_20625 [Rhodopseudomonas sp. P2A-2r]